MLIEALNLRWHYCRAAQQTFPSTTSRFLHMDQPNGCHMANVDDTIHDEKRTVEGAPICLLFASYSTELNLLLPFASFIIVVIIITVIIYYHFIHLILLETKLLRINSRKLMTPSVSETIF